MGMGLCFRLMIGSGLYGYVCNLSINHYGFNNSGAGAEGARPTIVEAAEGWTDCKHSHTTYSQSLT